MPSLETKDKFLKNYILGLSASLLSLKEHGLLSRAPPLEFLVPSFRAGGWVLTRTCKESKLQPEWDGPFQGLLLWMSSALTSAMLLIQSPTTSC